MIDDGEKSDVRVPHHRSGGPVGGDPAPRRAPGEVDEGNGVRHGLRHAVTPAGVRGLAGAPRDRPHMSAVARMAPIAQENGAQAPNAGTRARTAATAVAGISAISALGLTPRVCSTCPLGRRGTVLRRRRASSADDPVVRHQHSEQRSEERSQSADEVCDRIPDCVQVPREWQH